jgi:hypothetical protein
MPFYLREGEVIVRLIICKSRLACQAVEGLLRGPLCGLAIYMVSPTQAQRQTTPTAMAARSDLGFEPAAIYDRQPIV